MNKKGELYCAGCGIKLQSLNETLEGYIPPLALTNSIIPYCKRCHDLRHHNVLSRTDINPYQDYNEIFKTAAQNKSLIVFVVDIFNFKSSVLDIINQYLKNNRFILVLNKSDVLPQSVKEDKIVAWGKRRFAFSHNILKIILTSAKKNFNINELSETINSYRNGHDVYFVGVTNAGKSSLINAFLKNYKNETEKLITTIVFPNTTLKIIEIPLDSQSYVFDTPGLDDNSSMYNFVEAKLLKQIMPRKEIKPRVFQIHDIQSFYIGNLVRLDIIEPRKCSIIMYFSDQILIHRCKLANDDVKLTNLIKNKQIKPISMKINSIKDFVSHQITLDASQKCDIIIYGYGFITFRNCANMQINLLLPKNVEAEIIESLI